MYDLWGQLKQFSWRLAAFHSQVWVVLWYWVLKQSKYNWFLKNNYCKI